LTPVPFLDRLRRVRLARKQSWGARLKTRTIETLNGAVAVHESAGDGPPAVLIHGNSSSSRAFSRQLDGSLGERFRLVAIDLPGYGASDNARDPSAYSLPGHARAVRAAVDALGLDDVRFVGWSLGGHVALENSPDLPRGGDFLIFGTPPVGFQPPMGEAFLPNPAMRTVFAERIDRDQATALVASMFKPGFGDVPPFFVDDALRADGRARKLLGASIARGDYRDEVVVVRDLKAPLAVLHGAEEQLVNGAYFASLSMPTLWRGAVQTVAGAGHAPQWETPQAFDALLTAFIAETG
jgi:pimeloyl-ACP methyl ester carboxylesterase